MLVVDSSAIVDALASIAPNAALADRLEDGDLHAPHLVDVEVLHALRRLARSGDLTDERASTALDELGELRIHRYSHELLRGRMWELRNNMSAYDAAFVALSESLAAPLVTCDARLARAPGHRATIELFSRSRA